MWKRVVVSVSALGTLIGCSLERDIAGPELYFVAPQVRALTGDDPRAYWRARTDESVWADLGVARLVLVGLRAPGSDRGVVRGRAVVSADDQARAEAAALAVRGVSLVSRDRSLPILRVAVRDLDALRKLRRLPHVDYVEPDLLKAPPNGLLQDACGGGEHAGSLVTISDGDKHGPHFTTQGIPGAWGRGANGAGITIGLIDSGVDSAQTQLGSAFGNGQSAGRSITIASTREDGTHDSCGHGTHMAGILAAPRDGQNVVGIAWKASLISVRAVPSPLILEGSVTDVNEAIDLVAPSSKIIVMGFGSIYVFAAMTDKIDQWYSQGRMFLAPMGNSAPWHYALFPASLPTVVAVTGTSETCKWCRRDGSALDFEALTSNPTTGAVSLLDGAPIETSSQSSGATAVTAGIAALVWAVHPTWTREQVLSRMQQCSVYKVWKPQRGYGFVDANCAVQDPPPPGLHVSIQRSNTEGGDPDLIYPPTDPSQTLYVDFYNEVDYSALTGVTYEWLVMWNNGDSQPLSNDPTATIGFNCAMAGHTLELVLTIRADGYTTGRMQRAWYVTGSGCL